MNFHTHQLILQYVFEGTFFSRLLKSLTYGHRIQEYRGKVFI